MKRCLAIVIVVALALPGWTVAQPVRADDSMIDAMDLDDLGLRREWTKVGNSSYDPVSMLKLLVYGYSYGWRSSRKLERAIYHNLSFIWLMGGLKPDHKTISNFRKNNKKQLKKALKQCTHLCIELDLIEGNCLFIDGTKIRGSASINQSKTKEKWKQQLDRIDERIDALLEVCDRIDESETGSLVKLNKELSCRKKRKEKIEEALERMGRENQKRINATDPDCINFKSRQGSHAGYNAQIVVDRKHGLILNADVVAESNDSDQFSNQIRQANEILESPCKRACADAGYANVDNLKEMVDEEIDVIVPSQKQSLHNPKDEPFGKHTFQYDSEGNRYICPEGKILEYSHYSKDKNQYLYRFKKIVPCHQCRHFGICTTAKRGRAITRLANQELKEILEARYASEEGQEIYARRKEKVEAPFGHIKRNLNGGAFLLRGLPSVNAEFSIFATCYNVARMITLTGGVRALIGQLNAIPS